MAIVEITRWLTLGVVFLYGLSMVGSGFGLRLYRKTFFWLSALGALWLVLGEPALRSWQQYLAWGGNERTSYLVFGEGHPQFILFYAWGRFLAWRVVGAVAAVIIYWLSMRFIVKPSDGFKLNRNEALLIAFGIALAGWPGFVLYLLALLLLYVAILAFIQLRASSLLRASPRRRIEAGRNSASGLFGVLRGGGSDHGSSRPKPLLRSSAYGLRNSAGERSSPRFAVALPATLALITIPFIQHLLVWASSVLEINLLFYNVTNLSI